MIIFFVTLENNLDFSNNEYFYKTTHLPDNNITFINM